MFTAFLTNLDNFLTKYNYKTFFFCIYDNFIPAAMLPFVDASLNMFFYVLSFSSFIVTPICYGYTLYTELFILVETTVTHATNYLVAKAVSIALKFLLCIAVLIFVRGGIPRFRFDYLTRLG